MSNGCPLCCGVGRVLAFGVVPEPIALRCPECAGLEIVPASADEFPWSLSQIAPALPSPEATEVSAPVQIVDGESPDVDPGVAS